MLRSLNFAYAFRTLAKSPGFTAAVVLSLALGIGANAAIFSVVNGLLFHPAGLGHPEQLVAPRVSYQKLGLDKISMSATDFADIRDQRQIFSQAALQTLDGFNYTGGSSPERLQGALVSSSWFDVLGSRPILGRGFLREEDQPGANHVVVLSYKLWQRSFGGDRTIVGRSVELNQTPYRVVGVMPMDFRWPAEADLWVPLGLLPQAYAQANRFNESYFVVARLAPGVSYARAASVVQGLSQRVLEQVPYARGSQWSMVLQPLTEYTAGNLRRPMFLLFGAVALVLLIACSNVAGLMLVRATARSRELTIRTALGASRADLIGQALLETALLSLLGTALGYASAFSLLDALLALTRTRLSSPLFVRVDSHVLLFTACAGVLSALLFGLVPAWHIARSQQNQSQLKDGGRSDTEGRHRQRLRTALVAGQIALASILLIGAGLLLKTLDHLQQVNTGFQSRQVMTASVALPKTTYSNDDKQIAFFRTVLSHLSQTPGITAAGAANVVPFSGGDPTASFSIEGRIVPPTDPGFHGSSRVVTPEYFKALQIPLLAGRYFNDSDGQNGQPVALIDAELARRYWPHENPLGRRLRRGSRQSWATIVGVVGHVKQSSLAAETGRGVYYFSLYQQPQPEVFLVARGNVSSALLSKAIRRAVQASDPAQAVFDFKTMEERIALALGPQQFTAQLLLVFATVALFLAATGLYGVISYSVTRRTREIGIRTALGAEPIRVVGLVIGQAMKLVVIGLLAGLFAATFLGRLASSQLFQVSAFDPFTFAIAACVLTTAALLATALPAWRAAHIDPVTALRNE
ncbi:MAG TPA: ABC transporter permease [Bryobacteraceae bacterium]|nr:ABC transporter permease [Bryobacteraceae bacterium]